MLSNCARINQRQVLFRDKLTEQNVRQIDTAIIDRLVRKGFEENIFSMITFRPVNSPTHVLIKQLRSDILQTLAYDKVLADLLPINPTLVLYDLFIDA